MDIVFSTTTQLATAIRAGQVSAVEVLEAHLSQIETHNPALNAVVTHTAEQALEQARAADTALARGNVWGLLHGVPYTLKDAHSTQGVRTTVGFPPLADCVPAEDSTVAARLKAAGGILMGKTNVAEMLGDALQTANPLFGRTNNPWDIQRTPGGSSGGAAAAVASGMTPFEIGTDLAGSIRIPAHFCGVFGFKPTEHRVSSAGLIPDLRGLPRSVRIMSSIGPMARSVDDLALLYSIIAGPDGQDTDVPPVPVGDIPQPDLKTLRVAVATTFPGVPVTTSVRAAVEQLAAQLEPLCAAVDQPALPESDVLQDLSVAGSLIGMMIGVLQPDAHEPPIPFAQYLEALHRRDQAIVAWERFFDAWDVLLCPPAMTAAFSHRDIGAPIDVDGQGVSYWMANAHTTLFNYTGHPAVVLPYTLDGSGVPLGIQLVGKRWQDEHLLGIARALSGVTGEFQRPPGF